MKVLKSLLLFLLLSVIFSSCSEIEFTDEINVTIIGSNGEPIKGFNGAIDVHVSDVHNSLVNRYFHFHETTNTTLVNIIDSGDTSINVTSSTGFSVGDHIELKNGAYENHFPIITAIVGNIITLNKPLDNSFEIGDLVQVVNIDMAVSGSLSNPISFKIHPNTNETIHMIRFIQTMTHVGEGDDGLFGDQTELTNGVVLREYDGNNGKFTTITVWQNNQDIKNDMYDLEYTAKAKFGNFGTSGRFSIKTATGSKRELNANTGDYIEILVQDDLTGLTSYSQKGQGHISGE